MKILRKNSYMIPAIIISAVVLIAHSFSLPVRAENADSSISRGVQSDSSAESQCNVADDEVEVRLSTDGLDFYAYMNCDTAPDELISTILEARSRIISQTSWVTDDLNGWVEDCNGNIIEIVPKFHEIFPQDWEIPTDYGKLEN